MQSLSQSIAEFLSKISTGPQRSLVIKQTKEEKVGGTSNAQTENQRVDAESAKLSKDVVHLANILITNNLALYGINFVKEAILLLSRDVPNTLTNAHAWLFALCLSAKRVDDAVPYLDLDAGSFFLEAQESYPISAENVLLYFYYGGLVRMALHQFDAAAALFEQAVCLPTCSASAIQIEAHKKLILLNLCLGRSSNLPTYSSPAIQRASPSKCQQYYHVAIVYSDVVAQKIFQGKPSSIARLTKQLQKMSNNLEREKNIGLAHQVYSSAINASVAKLPTVFLRLPLAKVSKYTNMPEEALNVVAVLERFFHNQREIVGKIDAKTGTVRFAKRERTDAEMQAEISEAADACSALGTLTESCDRLLELHPTLLARSNRANTAAMALGTGMLPGTSQFADPQY